MHAPHAQVVTAALMLAAAHLACGLDAGGRLAVADAGSDAMVAPDDAAGTLLTGDDANPTTDVPAADDAADGQSQPRRDASTNPKPDAGSTPPKDAAPDGFVFTCSSCAQVMCPKQLAACAQGSQCLAYRDCSVQCGVSGGSNCGSTCGSMYPSGETAFAALTLCDLGCGAGCAAGLTTGTP